MLGTVSLPWFRDRKIKLSASTEFTIEAQTSN